MHILPRMMASSEREEPVAESEPGAAVPFDRDVVRFRAWEALPALALVLGLLAWGVPALWDHRVLDLGMAYNGGAEAWRSGHPERVRTWMSTPFLAVVMALVSRTMSVFAAERVLTALNLLLLSAVLALVWGRLRGLLPRIAWWATLTLAACFPPLISTVRWKQFNLIALTFALSGMDLIRRRRPGLGGALVGLSVSLKPLIFLLPLGLLARRESRRSGGIAVATILGLAVVSQGLLALRAGGAEATLGALANFSEKAETWTPHVTNFSPVGLLARGAGVLGVLPWERWVVRLSVLLLAWAALQATKERGSASWDLFAFACLLSPMLSPVAWSHYQILLAPMFVTLACRFAREGAAAPDWALLLFSYALAALAMTPLGTLPGALGAALGFGPPSIERDVPVYAIAQFAQYFLVFTALVWRSRGKGSA
jgi:hypothetical protein